mgnify:CR=1 FL=1
MLPQITGPAVILTGRDAAAWVAMQQGQQQFAYTDDDDDDQEPQQHQAQAQPQSAPISRRREKYKRSATGMFAPKAGAPPVSTAASTALPATSLTASSGGALVRSGGVAEQEDESAAPAPLVPLPLAREPRVKRPRVAGALVSAAGTPVMSQTQSDVSSSNNGRLSNSDDEKENAPVAALAEAAAMPEHVAHANVSYAAADDAAASVIPPKTLVSDAIRASTDVTPASAAQQDAARFIAIAMTDKSTTGIVIEAPVHTRSAPRSASSTLRTDAATNADVRATPSRERLPHQPSDAVATIGVASVETVASTGAGSVDKAPTPKMTTPKPLPSLRHVAVAQYDLLPEIIDITPWVKAQTHVLTMLYGARRPSAMTTACLQALLSSTALDAHCAAAAIATFTAAADAAKTGATPGTGPVSPALSLQVLLALDLAPAITGPLTALPVATLMRCPNAALSALVRAGCSAALGPLPPAVVAAAVATDARRAGRKDPYASEVVMALAPTISAVTAVNTVRAACGLFDAAVPGLAWVKESGLSALASVFADKYNNNTSAVVGGESEFDKRCSAVTAFRNLVAARNCAVAHAAAAAGAAAVAATALAAAWRSFTSQSTVESTGARYCEQAPLEPALALGGRESRWRAAGVASVRQALIATALAANTDGESSSSATDGVPVSRDELALVQQRAWQFTLAATQVWALTVAARQCVTAAAEASFRLEGAFGGRAAAEHWQVVKYGKLRFHYLTTDLLSITEHNFVCRWLID